MRANDPILKMKQLLGQTPETTETLVKICGIMDADTAVKVAELGADFIGLVFAESRRKVSLSTAQTISKALQQWREKQNGNSKKPIYVLNASDSSSSEDKKQQMFEWYQSQKGHLQQFVSQKSGGLNRPLLVGVFADNETEFVEEIAKSVPLDIVQFSGHEELSEARKCSVPSWKATHVGAEETAELIINKVSQPNF